MAAVDYFGNVIRVTSDGTIDLPGLFIEEAYVWSLNSTATLTIFDSNSGVTAELLKFNTEVPASTYIPLHLRGYVGPIRVSPLTACTAWIIKR